MRLLKLPDEREGPPTQSTNTQLRGKKTRILAHIGQRAKKRTLLRRMKSKVSTRQRRVINLQVAAKAEKRVGGQKAEKSLISIKAMTEEVAQGAKTEMIKGKKRSQKMITAKIETRVTSLIKSKKRTPKEEMVRKPGQSHKARKEQQKMVADLAAETGIVDLQCQRKKKKNEKEAGSEGENVVGVGIGDTTVKESIKGEVHTGTRNNEQEVLTETSQETPIEIGDPEARVIGETTAKIAHPIERTKTEKPQTKEDDVATARTVIGTGKRRVAKAQTPNETGQTVLPERDEVL